MTTQHAKKLQSIRSAGMPGNKLTVVHAVRYIEDNRDGSL